MIRQDTRSFLHPSPLQEPRNCGLATGVMDLSIVTTCRMRLNMACSKALRVIPASYHNSMLFYFHHAPMLPLVPHYKSYSLLAHFNKIQVYLQLMYKRARLLHIPIT